MTSRRYRLHVDVRLLYFDGCPNWRETERHLSQALATTGSGDVVVLVEVTTPEQAERLAFRGSPTVLLDGIDPFADGGSPVGLSCRVYPTDAGLRGSPAPEQLLAAVVEGRGRQG